MEHVKRVLLPELKHKDQTLVLLYAANSSAMAEADLIAAVEPKDVPGYRHKVLRALHSGRLIEYHQDRCSILPLGLAYVEGRYAEWIGKLNKKEGQAQASKNGLPDSPDEYLSSFTDLKKDTDRMLAGAYFIQAKSADDTFATEDANTLLKNHGINVGNPYIRKAPSLRLATGFSSAKNSLLTPSSMLRSSTWAMFLLRQVTSSVSSL